MSHCYGCGEHDAHCTCFPKQQFYVAPSKPAAQPEQPEPGVLTDEQINAVMNACLNDWDWRAFARAIEAYIKYEQSSKN